MRTNRLVFLFILLAAASLAQAQTQADDAASLLETLKTSLAPAISKVTSHAIGWLGVFASLQFCITNYNLFKSDADIQAHVAKLVGAVAWVGFCLYLIDNGPNFLRGVGDEWMGLVGVDMPSPGSIMARTFGLAGTLAAVAVGVGIASNTAGTLLIYVVLFILFVGIFMLQLEVALIAMLSPLSFAFLGLNPLRDQGIAPFKALVSLGYRIILLTVLLSGYVQLNTTLSDAIKALSIENIASLGVGDTLNTIMMAIGGYILLGYLVFKSDSIASTLASGATSMGTGDVAQAAAAGAAVGAAIASGGAAAGAGAGRAPQAMSDFLSRLTGGGSISNASAMGNGGDAHSMPPPPASPPATMSLSGMQGSDSSGATGAVAAGTSESGRHPQGGGRSGAPAEASAARVGITSGRYGVDPSKNSGKQDGVSPHPLKSTRRLSPEENGATNGGSSTQKNLPDASNDSASTDRLPSGKAGSTAEATIGGPSSGHEPSTAPAVSPDLGRHAKALGNALQDLGRHLQHQNTATHVSVNSHDPH